MGTSLASVSLGTDVHAWLVSAGTTHTCVRTSEGRVKCWGRNNYGQLGLGDTQNRGDQPGEMGDSLPFVDLGVGRTAKSVAAGHEFTCAWLDNDQVKCWGKNDWGMLGLGDTAHRGNAPGEMGDALPAVSLGTGYSARSLSVGFEHTCLRTHLGTYKCWGRADYGKLGLGDEEDRGDEAGEMGNSLPELQLLAP